MKGPQGAAQGCSEVPESSRLSSSRLGAGCQWPRSSHPINTSGALISNQHTFGGGTACACTQGKGASAEEKAFLANFHEQCPCRHVLGTGCYPRPLHDSCIDLSRKLTQLHCCDIRVRSGETEALATRGAHSHHLGQPPATCASPAEGSPVSSCTHS